MISVAVDRPGRPLGRLLYHLLNFPIFYKIFVANSLIILFGAVFGVYVTREFSMASQPALVLLFAVLGLAASLIVNFLLVRLALAPLTRLQRVVDAVDAGDLTARVSPGLFGDPQTNRLASTFNTMLDRLRDDRRTIEAQYRQLQALSRQILEAQEGERRRIARELHDDTGQALTSVLIGLKVLENSTTLDQARARAAALREVAHQALEDVHRLAVDLRPSTLDDLGLVPALRQYVNDHAPRLNLEISFEARGLQQRLSPEAEIALYRVVQEALTNVAKHSGATRATVRIEVADGAVVATVSDNGRGFDLAEVRRSGGRERGLGLFGMEERMSLVGGQLTITSSPGAGTVVSAALPLRLAEGVQ